MMVEAIFRDKRMVKRRRMSFLRPEDGVSRGRFSRREERRVGRRKKRRATVTTEKPKKLVMRMVE